MTTALAPRRYGGRRILRSGDSLSIVRAGRAEGELPTIGPVTISALPQVANLLMYQGDTWFLQLNIYDTDGQPVNMEQEAVLSQIRSDVADLEPTVLATFTASTVGNQITLFLSHEDTTPLHGTAVWDVQVTTLIGWVTTLAAGSVTITQEVSRAPVQVPA